MKTLLPARSSLALLGAAGVMLLVAVPAQQSNQPAPTNGSQNPSARVEKFHVKQEFGPQSASRRGDRMVVVSPPQNSGTQSAASASSSGRQSDATTRRKRKQQESCKPSGAVQFNPVATAGTQKSVGPGSQPQAGANSNSTSPR